MATTPITNNPPNPQVESTASKQVSGFSTAGLLQADPTLGKAFIEYQKQQEAALIAAATKAAVAENGGQPIDSIDQQIILAEAQLQSKLDATAKYKDQIIALGVGTVTQTGTPPPSNPDSTVSSTTNPQVVQPSTSPVTPPVTKLPADAAVDAELAAMAAETARIQAVADANRTNSAATVSNTSNPQVPADTGKVTNFSYSTLLLADPDAAKALLADQRAIQQGLVNQQVTEYRATSGLPTGQPLPPEVAAKIQADTFETAKAQAQSQYKDQIVAAGAGTLVPETTPPPTTAASTNTGSDTGGYSRMVGDVRADGAVLEKYDDNGDPVYVTRAPATNTAVSPELNAQVPPNTGKIAAVSTETLLQNDPETAREYTAFKTETAAQLTAQRIAEQEAAQGQSISVSSQVQIAARAEIDATADANFRYQDQIEAAGAATVVPADTPPPAPSPAAVINNPQVVVPPTKIAAVSTETLLQNDPTTAREYAAFKTETAQQLTEQRLAEAREAYGGEISVSQQVQIEARANIDATADANFRYQDQIQAAGAGTVVPADTPPPSVTAPAVSPDANSQVPADTGKITDFSYSTLVSKDPDTAKSLITDQRALQQELANQQVAEYRAVTGTAPGTPLPDEEIARITVETDLAAKAQTQLQYKDQIVAAGAGTLVPADTPLPTTASTTVNPATDQQVPPPSTAEALIDPDTGEVLGYVDATTGQTVDAPAAVTDTNQPAVQKQADSVVTSVNDTELSQTNATLYQNYQSDLRTTESKLLEDKIAIATDVYGGTPNLTEEQLTQFRLEAATEAQSTVNAQYKDQLEESGAATSEPAGTPPPTVAATPPSPSPYERFIAQEAAATDAAQAEATARFNAQFDVVEDPQGPQAFPIADATNIEVVPVDDNATDYGEFFGNGVEPDFVDYGQELGNGDPGLTDFYGNDAGEFQDLATEPAAADPVDYGDFIGGTGEDTAFVDYGQELGNGDGESASFGDFFDGAADAAGSFFGSLTKSAAAVSPGSDPSAKDSVSGLPVTAIKTPSQLAAERQAAAVAQAKAQAQVNAQRKQANNGDWRVRIRLAGGADYLYKATSPGILKPLAVTDGVVFPYTPQINTQYAARYSNYELTHSNYKGYFYQGSNVGEVNITATFTAQDTSEAEYLLAVIHFFRSVTKMFYGQDDASVRGAPPPLVFLQGLGEYQFNLSPCVVASFNYTLPADVDYIRAYSPNYNGTNLLQRRDRQNLPISPANTVNNRLSNAGLTKGGINTTPAPPTLGTNSPTYVPTKMEIQLVLLPVQTRSQVSQQFSLKEFANGNLVRGGFW